MTKAGTGRRRQRRSSGRQEAGGGRREEEPGGKREEGGGRRNERGCDWSPCATKRLRQNGPDHLARSISELRTVRMAQAKRAGPPRERHLGAQYWKDVSNETGRTTSRTRSEKSTSHSLPVRSSPAISFPSPSSSSTCLLPPPPPPPPPGPPPFHLLLLLLHLLFLPNGIWELRVARMSQA